ncbi:MAG: DUF5711 family protein, partial [Clostridiales bacterium]|nr:DUF5711 family protein [Clostridiales bacterium]
MKKTAFAAVMAAVIVIIAAVAYIFHENYGGEQTWRYVFELSGGEAEYNVARVPSFYSSENIRGYFYATKDAARFITADGKEKFNYAYDMTSPVLKGDGGVCAVAERRGKVVIVFNEDGIMYEVASEEPILFFTVSEGGQVCIITQSGNDYETKVYTSSGTLIQKIKDPSGDVFPALCGISSDGRIIATVYYDISGAKLKSTIKFFYLNKSESLDYPTGFFAVNSDYIGEMVYAVKFLEGNRLAVISDETVSLIEPEAKCEKQLICETPSGLSAAGFSEKLIAIFQQKGNQLEVYNSKGEFLWAKEYST